MDSKLLNRINSFNSVSLVIEAIFFVCHSNLVGDETLRRKMGYIHAPLLMFVVGINVLMIIVEIVEQMKRERLINKRKKVKKEAMEKLSALASTIPPAVSRMMAQNLQSGAKDDQSG